jgi:hypothetical protein
MKDKHYPLEVLAKSPIKIHNHKTKYIHLGEIDNNFRGLKNYHVLSPDTEGSFRYEIDLEKDTKFKIKNISYSNENYIKIELEDHGKIEKFILQLKHDFNGPCEGFYHIPINEQPYLFQKE